MFIALFALVVTATTASAQWAVIDPTNLAQGIVNTTKQIMQTSTTAQNMINNFKETIKIYEQGKQYYDALKSVHNLVKDARKVQQTILLVGEISDIYVNNFQKMMADDNFTVGELAAIANGYTKLLSEGSNLLTDLKGVTSANGLSLNDSERMAIIDKVYNDVLYFRNLTNYYTRKNIGVSVLRAKEKGDLSRVASLYGSPEQRYW